jgi:hypothetical protein
MTNRASQPAGTAQPSTLPPLTADALTAQCEGDEILRIHKERNRVALTINPGKRPSAVRP